MNIGRVLIAAGLIAIAWLVVRRSGVSLAIRDPGSGRGSGVGDAGSAFGIHPLLRPLCRSGTAGIRPRESRIGSRNPGPDAAVTLTPEMVSRAGIKTVAAVTGTGTTRLHLPGVVQHERVQGRVAVTALVSGRVTQVRAESASR